MLISTVSKWLYEEFWRSTASLDHVIGLVRTNAGSTQIPLTLVATDSKGTPVGTASLIECDLSTRPDLTPWLAGVYVIPEARGRGVATALCQKIENELKRLGLISAYLYTDTQQRLYQRRGWQVFSQELHGKKNVTVMKVTISPGR